MADLLSWPLLYARSLAQIVVLLVLLLGILPRWLWTSIPAGTGLAGGLARAIWTLLSVGLLVHVLAVLRLYEGLTLVILLAACLGVVWWRSLWAGQGHEAVWSDLFRRLLLGLEWLGKVRRRTTLRGARERVQAGLRCITGYALLSACALALPIGVAAWQRISDAAVRVSPALSDAEVTIKWLRLLENSYDRVNLYVDGVYTMGMYPLLSLVRKLSSLNAIILLQTMGPLVGLSMVLAGAAALYVLTKRSAAAAAFVWLYGTMSAWLPISLDRQAAHNSEEFGFLFVMPAAAFAIRYLRSGERWEAITAAAALGMAVLTHPVAAVYAGIGILVPALLLTALQGGQWRRLVELGLWCTGAALVAAAPPAIGLMAGIGWHGPSIAYAAGGVGSRALVWPPVQLWLLPLLAVAAGGAAWWRRSSSAAAVALALGMAALAAVAVTWFAPLGFLYDRGQDPAAMLVAGAACALLPLGIERLGARAPKWLPAGMLLVAFGLSWWHFPPQQARPYRVFNDAMLYQYLRMDAAHAPGTWGLVAGPDGYTLSIGRAQHIYPHELDTRYRIGPTGLVDLENPGDPVKLDLFFVVDHKPPEGLPLTIRRAEDREAAARVLEDWIDRARAAGLPLHLVYSDPTLAIWELHFCTEVDLRAASPSGCAGL